MSRGGVRHREAGEENRPPASRRDPGREAGHPDGPVIVQGVDASREDSLFCHNECGSDARDDYPRSVYRNGASNREAIFYAMPDTRGNRPIPDRNIWNGTSARRDVSTTIRFGKISPPERRGQRTRQFPAK